MSYIYKNITGSTATELVLDPNYSYDNMTLCNIHATDEVSVDLYITRTYTSTNESRVAIGDDGNWNALGTTTDSYYIIKANYKAS